MKMEYLQISEKEMNGYVLLNVAGSITTYTYTDLQDRLYSLIETTPVCVNLEKVDDLTSAGLGSLLATLELSIEKEHALYLLNPSAAVRRIIDLTGFLDDFNVISSIDEIEVE